MNNDGLNDITAVIKQTMLTVFNGKFAKKRRSGHPEMRLIYPEIMEAA